MYFLHGLVTLSLILAIDAVNNCKPKSCQIGLDSKKPACGSDGTSYPNRCHLELARCHNLNLTLAHRGACKHPINCVSFNRAGNKFKAQCRTDGNYASGQCYPEIEYCWCVTPQGVPIPFTSTRYISGKKHKCGRRTKTIRRSSKNRKNGKACTRQDKALFNSNLIQIFTSEWSRENAMNNRYLANDKLVLDWKFKLMDIDFSDNLDKTEYRDLRRLVKKVVKPKRCAKSFAKACDMNRDQVIGRQEWAQCLTRDGLDDVKGEDTGNLDEEDEEEDESDSDIPPNYRPSSVLFGGGSKVVSNGPNYDDTEEKREDDPTDCLSDRAVALNDDGNQLYVPDCTLDGRYSKVQCYKSAGYCWCVNEDTGKNIAGTAVKNQTPKCDQISSASRPMKGCPDEKKVVFLKDLLDYLHKSMVKETNGTNAGGSSWRSTKEDQIASWSFIFFDKNKNKMLDKIEWKGFKDTMILVKNLRKCGKKLPRYCDINKDRQISMTEWLDCLNTHRHQEQSTTITPSSIRTGKNPLTVLMED